MLEDFFMKTIKNNEAVKLNLSYEDVKTYIEQKVIDYWNVTDNQLQIRTAIVDFREKCLSNRSFLIAQNYHDKTSIMLFFSLTSANIYN